MIERNLTQSRRCGQSCQSRAGGRRRREQAPRTAVWRMPAMAVPGSASSGRVPQKGMPECQTASLQDPPGHRGRENWVRSRNHKKSIPKSLHNIMTKLIKGKEGVLWAPQLCRAGRWHWPGSP